MSAASLLHSIEDALAPAREVVRPVFSDHRVLAAWAVLVAASVGVLWWDLRRNNEAIPSLMRAVWSLVVVYSGPAGLALYWYAGRTQISQDSLWRRGVRSTAHCYSGCGAGEVTGVVLLVGVLAIGNSLVTTLGTFAFAYTFGYALTVGPLLQDGETLTTALADALYTETPSITVMEVTAIGTDLLLAGGATIGEPLFWGALAFSLSVGFVAAFPVNVALLRVGVKEGMANPAELAGSSA
ncbi:DUF4396 domain-containing protein [Halobacterium sp. KA-4]|jgi:hypothetical protein|uniref:DUF4396 domain-containing protein n=1 Tax=Halobacterium sp. KA-4 TaxID=2896367 RepID=UPI001E3F868E|nr:DUF4396 domain-containing protein [Halobacterium sp. KA-4]MCD2199478.1 DUF4396 domain-containing protein [Halobacterium sp. KA-4]